MQSPSQFWEGLFCGKDLFVGLLGLGEDVAHVPHGVDVAAGHLWCLELLPEPGYVGVDGAGGDGLAVAPVSYTHLTLPTITRV